MRAVYSLLVLGASLPTLGEVPAFNFFAGEVIDAADGDDIDFFKLELTLTF